MGLQTEGGNGHQNEEQRGQSYPLTRKINRREGIEKGEEGKRRTERKNEHNNTCNVMKLDSLSAILSRTLCNSIYYLRHRHTV